MSENNITKKKGRTMNAKLAIYHPNAKGTGGAVKFSIRPAIDEKEGGIVATIASQKTIGNRNSETPTYPTFDFENAVSVDLGFIDILLMLQVFRGETESINDGRGIFKREDGKKKIVNLRHCIEPVCGYVFEATEAADDNADGAEKVSRIFFSSCEALGICEAITGAMPFVAFGDLRI